MSTGTLQDCQRACQQVFCVQEKFYLAARGFITLQFGEGGSGFSDFVVSLA
jgi:hypothetical protein